MASLQAMKQSFEEGKKYATANQRILDEKINEQRQQEAEIISQTNSFCPLEKIASRTTRAENIEEALKKGYGDANILKALMCINDSLILLPGGSGLARNQKIRELIRDLRQIGGESAEGYAMLANVKGKTREGKDLLVVKSPRKLQPELRADQIHEYFVGVYGTNLLRNKIPNFAFILGLFECSPPYIDAAEGDPKQIPRALTYCQNVDEENQVYYLLYENVVNSKTLRDFISDGCTFEEYLNVLTQIVLAIDMAYEAFDYTHYDLHDLNVLVRELPEEIIIPYEVGPGVTHYLKTKHVATIIDFGRNYIKYKGKSYGYSFPDVNIFPDRAYPMYDIYKILMFSLYTAIAGEYGPEGFMGLTDTEMCKQELLQNPDVFLKAKILVTYFNPYLVGPNGQSNTVGNYLMDALNYYYTLPYLKEYDLPPRYFYYHGIALAFPDTLSSFMSETPVSSDNLYGCAKKGVCLTLEKALANFTDADVKYIDDPYTFYEMLLEIGILKPFENYEKSRLSTEALRDPEIVTFLQRSKPLFQTHITKLLSDAKEHLTRYKTLGQKMQIVSIEKRVFNPFQFRPDALRIYRHFIVNTVEMVDHLTSFNNIEIIATALIGLFPDEAHRLTVPGMRITYDKLPSKFFTPNRQRSSSLNSAIRSIQEDVNYINSLSREERQKVLQFNPNARWLFTKMPGLTSAIEQLP